MKVIHVKGIPFERGVSQGRIMVAELWPVSTANAVWFGVFGTAGTIETESEGPERSDRHSSAARLMAELQITSHESLELCQVCPARIVNSSRGGYPGGCGTIDAADWIVW